MDLGKLHEFRMRYSRLVNAIEFKDFDHDYTEEIKEGKSLGSEIHHDIVALKTELKELKAALKWVANIACFDGLDEGYDEHKTIIEKVCK